MASETEIVAAPLGRRALGAGIDLAVYVLVASEATDALEGHAWFRRAQEFRVGPDGTGPDGVYLALSVARVLMRNLRSPGALVLGLRRVDTKTGGALTVPGALLSVGARLAWGRAADRAFGAVDDHGIERAVASLPELRKVQDRFSGDRSALDAARRAVYERTGRTRGSRSLLRAALTVGLPLLPAFWSRRHQTAFDRLSRTMVVIDVPVEDTRPASRRQGSTPVAVPADAPPFSRTPVTPTALSVSPETIDLPVIERVVNAFCAFGVNVDDISAADVDGPGLYAIQASTEAWRRLGLGDPPDDRPLYVGRAAESVAKRELQAHFGEVREGQRSPTARSTLRRSLAALLAPVRGFQGLPSSPTAKTFSEYGLSADQDAALTGWMKENLRLVVWPSAGDLKDLERDVVIRLEPPLNLTHVTTKWTKPVREARRLLAEQAKMAAGV